MKPARSAGDARAGWRARVVVAIHESLVVHARPHVVLFGVSHWPQLLQLLGSRPDQSPVPAKRGGAGGHKPIPGRRWRLVVRAFFVPVAPLSRLRARIASVGIPRWSLRHWRSHRRRALRSHPPEWMLGI